MTGGADLLAAMQSDAQIVHVKGIEREIAVHPLRTRHQGYPNNAASRSGKSASDFSSFCVVVRLNIAIAGASDPAGGDTRSGCGDDQHSGRLL
jgi:hypothetical protein